MLKRRGGPQAPPTRPPAHRTRTTDVSAGARSAETPPSSRAAWLSAPGVTARERAAADHYARLVHAHLQCQVCQEALRARLHHQRRLGVQCCGRRRAVSPPPPPPPPPALAQLTAAAAATTALDDVTTEAWESNVWSAASTPVAVASSSSSQATLPGGEEPQATLPGGEEQQPVYWADVGWEAWNEYWETRSTLSGTTVSRDDGRVPEGFIARARSIAHLH